MVGIVVNKGIALTLGIVEESNLDIHPIVGDKLILTDVAVENLGSIVQEHGFEVYTEDQLLNLLTNK